MRHHLGSGNEFRFALLRAAAMCALLFGAAVVSLVTSRATAHAPQREQTTHR